MALQLGARLNAGASPEKADKAAEELAGYENWLASIETRLTLLTWMIGNHFRHNPGGVRQTVRALKVPQ